MLGIYLHESDTTDRRTDIRNCGTVQKWHVLGTSRRVYAHRNSVLVTWKLIKGIEC